MLWMKSWIETRLRLVFAIFVFLVVLMMLSNAIRSAPQAPTPPSVRFGFFLSTFSLFFVMQGIILAGAGIKTQTPFRAGKGLHSSMHFTLSMPVSRRRIVATRVSLGLLELIIVIVVGCAGFWFMLGPEFSQLNIRVADVVAYGLTTLSVVSACFSFTTLLSAFLDDLWQVWLSFIGIGLFRGLFAIAPMPESIDPFRSLGMVSPLVTHSIPWGVVWIFFGVAAVLLFGTVKMVQRRDY